MSKMVGLFTRQELKSSVTKAPTRKLDLSLERIRELGKSAVDNMNPQAKTIHMKPSGSKNPDVLIIGEAPGKQEDSQGEPFIGPSGKFLRSKLNYDYEHAFTNVVHTLPKLRGGKRTPTQLEIEAYRNDNISYIEKVKPKAVVGTGAIPFGWATGLNDKITDVRGRRYPIQFGSHECWFYPVLHPAFILRTLDSDKLTDKIPGAEWERTFDRDMENVYKTFEDQPFVVPDSTAWENVTYINDNFSTVLLLIDHAINSKLVAFDFETSCLRPYERNAKILTCGLGFDDRYVAFPIDHPQARWSKENRNKVVKALHRLFLAKVAKTAHNLSFDLEWALWLTKDPQILLSNWHCSRGQAYILDERKTAQSLNSLSLQHFGIAMKALAKGSKTEGLMTTEGDLDRARLEQANLDDVLRYNALDAKFHLMLYEQQEFLLKEIGQQETYLEHIKRVPAVVFAQYQGLPVDQVEVKRIQDQIEKEIKPVELQINKTKGVKLFEERFGTFNPGSTQQITKIFRDILERDEGRRGGKYSTDKTALAAMSDEPLAKLLLKRRELLKIRGTYVDPLSLSNKDTVVYPDGKIHANFKHTSTDTARMAISQPSCQNWPKRKNAEIRRSVAALDGWVMISADYGQQEFRNAAMVSHDELITKACWTDYDVHMEWAKEIYKVWPKTFRKRHGKKDEKLAWKDWRSEVKNQFVFPLIFGASYKSIARNLEMPEEVLLPVYEKAKRLYKGITDWQNETIKFADKHGYVETLGGHRRHYPMNKNMGINMPIQGSAAEQTASAMHRLCRYAIEKGRYYLAPVLQVHDDLDFFAPVAKAEGAIKRIARVMCEPAFKWAEVVPAIVEVSVGKNWADLKKVGEFRSDKPEEISNFKLVI